MNSVIPQIAHDAKPANPRRVNMTSSLPVSGSSAPRLPDADRRFVARGLARQSYASQLRQHVLAEQFDGAHRVSAGDGRQGSRRPEGSRRARDNMGKTKYHVA